MIFRSAALQTAVGKMPDGPLLGQFGPIGATTLSDVADGMVVFMVLSQGTSSPGAVLASARTSVVTNCGAAAIAPLGAVNGASYSAASLASSSFATIFGSGLSGETAQAGPPPYPVNLAVLEDGSSVSLPPYQVFRGRVQRSRRPGSANRHRPVYCPVRHGNPGLQQHLRYARHFQAGGGIRGQRGPVSRARPGESPPEAPVSPGRHPGAPVAGGNAGHHSHVWGGAGVHWN